MKILLALFALWIVALAGPAWAAEGAPCAGTENQNEARCTQICEDRTTGDCDVTIGRVWKTSSFHYTDEDCTGDAPITIQHKANGSTIYATIGTLSAEGDVLVVQYPLGKDIRADPGTLAGCTNGVDVILVQTDR